MLTGYFNYLQYNPSWQKKCIAITYNKPVNVELQVYKPLSPGKFLFKYKNQNSQYGESDYMQDYWAQIQNLDPEKVLEEKKWLFDRTSRARRAYNSYSVIAVEITFFLPRWVVL